MRHLIGGGVRRRMVRVLMLSAAFAGFHREAGAGEGAYTRAYFTEFKSNTVGVIDTRDNRMTTHVPVPRGAHGIAVLPDGSRVFVSSDESSAISVIDPATDEIIKTIPTGKQPHGLAAGKDGRFVYACIFGDNQVLEIDGRNLKVARTFDAPNPHNLAPSPDGNALYVAAQKPGETGILKINLRTGKTEAFVPTATIPRSINLSPDGRTLVSTQSDLNEVQWYSTDPLKRVRTVTVGGAPHHVIFTPDGKSVLVVDQTTNDLTIIDASALTVTGTVTVGRKPHWIAPTSDSKYAYVTDESSDQVSIVDLGDRDVESTVAVGEGPRKIALCAARGGARMTATPGRTGSARAEYETGTRVTVTIEGPPPRFVPATLTVDQGTTVEWVNNGKGIHTVTDNDGAWDSGSLSPGETYTRTFDRKGTFGYYCVPHRSMGMAGTIVVR